MLVREPGRGSCVVGGASCVGGRLGGLRREPPRPWAVLGPQGRGRRVAREKRLGSWGWCGALLRVTRASGAFRPDPPLGAGKPRPRSVRGWGSPALGAAGGQRRAWAASPDWGPRGLGAGAAVLPGPDPPASLRWAVGGGGAGCGPGPRSGRGGNPSCGLRKGSGAFYFRAVQLTGRNKITVI